MAVSHVAPAAPLPRTFQDFEALEIMLGAAQAAALGQNQGSQEVFSWVAGCFFCL